MAMLNKLRLRLRALFFGSKMEEELDAEVRFHLEREIEENIVRGMTPEEARYAAIRSFGGVERVKEESRDERGVRLLEEVWQDLRYGARMLFKNPGFTLIAVLTLALGIGANITIFSVINAVLLHPLPYPEAERLVFLWTEVPKQNIKERASAYANFSEWRDQNKSFEDLAVFDPTSVTLTGAAEPEGVMSVRASANLFPLLGMAPLLGRTFTAEEEQQKARVVVLSHGLWQRRFGASPNILGQTLEIDGVSSQVIGVMPEHFQFSRENTPMWEPH